MRIAHVSVTTLSVLTTRGGAIQRRVLELAKAQVREGNDVVVYSPGFGSSDAEVDGVRIRHVRCRLPLPARHFEFLRGVVAKVRTDSKRDVVHFHSQPEGAWFIRGSGSRSVLSYDFFRFRRANRGPRFRLYQNALSRFDRLLPVSHYCMEESHRFWGFPLQKASVLYNGVNLMQFRPDESARVARRRLLGVDGFVVLYVGRVCRQKGSDTLLDAWTKIRNNHQDIRLVIAGPIDQFNQDADPDGWRERIKEAGVVYLGPIEESELASLYNAADVFVLPTRELEMFGMVAVEAQASGVPVLASTDGGLPEILSQSSAEFFPPGNSQALAEKLMKLATHPERRRELCKAGIENSSRYSWTRIARDTQRVYEEIGCPTGGGTDREPVS